MFRIIYLIASTIIMIIVQVIYMLAALSATLISAFLKVGGMMS